MPKTPPEPTPFFARKMIGLEVTPLMAFIGTVSGRRRWSCLIPHR